MAIVYLALYLARAPLRFPQNVIVIGPAISELVGNVHTDIAFLYIYSYFFCVYIYL